MHDPHGRENTVTDARTGTTTYTFNDADQVVAVTTPAPGPGQSAQTTTTYYDNMGRVWKTTLADNTSLTNEYFLTGLLQKTYGSRTYPVEYTYDAQGRMKTMKTWTNYPSGNPATTTWNYDIYRGWVYQYDSLGQVVSGKKYWSDGTPVAGQQFEYAFDDIGNRETTAAGGDQFGLNLRSANHTNNALNQLTSRGVPGYVDIMGATTNTATVTVNNQPTYRHGDYFRAELTADNSAAALWFGVTNVAVLNNGTNADIVTSATGNVFVAKSPEVFSYDADGNVTNDGRWAFIWDAENRLASMASLTNSPADSKRRLTFGYDYQGRRITKTVEKWTGSTWTMTVSNKFVYDGWNLLAELNATNNSVIRSYLCGLDLSGTMQGAGGVGGLLMVTDVANGTHFFAYDGNGNVAALVNAGDGTVSASYEYGPFGELVRQIGLLAKENPFRFSTKYQDSETDLLYYGFRYYNPSAGRWLSRDPIEEKGGENLYGFVGNEPIQNFDPLGLTTGSISVLFSKPVNKFVHAGWTIRFRWTPPADWSHSDKVCCGRCTKVIWVQNFSWIIKKTGLQIPVSQDWTKDWDETDHSGNSDLWECGKSPRGHRKRVSSYD